MTAGTWVRTGRAAIVVAGVVAAAGSAYLQVRNGDPGPKVALAVTAELAFIAAGLVARARWPANRTGLLMVLVGFGLAAEDVQLALTPAIFTLGLLLVNVSTPLLTWLVLSFPTGSLGARSSRVVVVGSWLLIAIEAATVPLADVDYYRPAGSNLLFVGRLPALSQAVDAVVLIGGAALAGAAMLILIVRFARASPAARAILWPVYLAAIICGLAVVLASVGDQLTDSNAPYRIGIAIYGVGFALLPVLFLIGLLRFRLHRTPASDLLAGLGDLTAAGEVQAALRLSLADPALELHTGPDRPPAPGGRAVTPLMHGSETVGWLVHDAALGEDIHVLRAVASATALSLVNQRLAAHAGEQYAELQTAAARLAGIADATRRQVERDLHDGAQQQIVTATLQLRLVQSALGPALDPDTRALVDGAAASLDNALRDLRALARGMHPAILSEAGLADALRVLAERCPIPVEVDCADLTLPGPAESAFYFAAAECLTNIVKHASASRVWLTVSAEGRGGRLIVADDGSGGARFDEAGTGLSGLRDRFRVLGGELTITDRPGGGTQVTGWLP